MKKVCSLLLVNLFTLLCAFSQDSLKSTHGEDYFRPTKNNLTTELNINPFKGELSLNNALNQIKVRYFTADLFALRLGFIVNSKKVVENNISPYGTNPTTIDETKKTSAIGLNFGIEKHFKGTRRLAPYIGGELMIAFKSSSHEIENGDYKTKITGAWRTTLSYYNTGNGINVVYGNEERGYTKVGINAVAGFDFYLAKHFYFGYELVFGAVSTKFKNIDVINTYSQNSGPPSAGNGNTESAKDFSFGPNLVNGIRLGFVF